MESWIIQNIELIATLTAIVIGPVFAVIVTRWLDNRREKVRRKYEVLSELMRTRRSRLDPAHVSALNLVELEFHSHPKIRTSYRAYVRHLNSVWPTEPNELARHSADGDDLFADFLSDLASSLGYKFDKRELERLGYIPTALGRQFENHLANTQYMREVLEGRRSLPIKNFVQDDRIYPPPPKSTPFDQTETVSTLPSSSNLELNDRGSKE